MNHKLVPSLLLMVLPCLSQATDLLDVYKQALESDPIFRKAANKFHASAESIRQAQAALRPQITANTQVSRNRLQVHTSTASGEQLYNSNQWQLTASQTIFNYQAWRKVQQANAGVKAAHATFNDAAQDLIIRTANAYFDVLLAKDNFEFAQAKLDANTRQLAQAQERFKVGIDTITSVYEAKAAHDQSVAEIISAQNNQINQYENLRKLTNQHYQHLATLRENAIPLSQPIPNNANAWAATSLKQNYKLFSAKYNLEAAREQIKATAASGWPTLMVTGSSGQIHNSGATSSVFAPAFQGSSNIALAVNFPVYTGGLVESKTRQAKYDFQTTSAELEEIYRNIDVSSHIAFNTIVDGISKVKADKQSVRSQKKSLASTEAQFQVGTRTMVDVVTAQQHLYEAQKQLASDQYTLINSMLRLKYLAGSLSVADLQKINSWLATTKSSQASRHKQPIALK
ncbi:MAG: TolC family outer membrane protein [Legionella sp.]